MRSARWSVEGALEAERLSRAISAYLRGLSQEKRRVFIWRYWYARSVREIARHLGCSETRVANMLSRTRKGLRQYLEKEDLYHG